MTWKQYLGLIATLLVIFSLFIIKIEMICSSTCIYYPMTTDEIIQWEATKNHVEEEDVITPQLNSEDIQILANVIYGEARGLSDTEKSAVAWCVLNRLDNGNYGNTIREIVSAPNQFVGYDPDRVYTCSEQLLVLEECEHIARDVLIRYAHEQAGEINVGRTLPKEYIYFVASNDGEHNVFTIEWKSTDYWDWSLLSPYV